MTSRQRGAIVAIATEAAVDPDHEARGALGVGFEDLTLNQASALIDRLKRYPGPAGQNPR